MPKNYFCVIKIRAWWLFYGKIFWYSLLLCGVAGIAAGTLFSTFDPDTVGISYAFFSPFMHLYFYELGKPREYYFYANLGLIKPHLWLITGGIALLLFSLIAILS